MGQLMKITAVVQRYGEDVIGGAESLARKLCLRLSKEHHVTVITSCALDYRNWENIFPEGESADGEVHVIRFPVSGTRNWKRFGYYSSLLYRIRNAFPLPRSVEEHWVKAQGPCCPALPGRVKEEGINSDVVLFFSCLYYPTVFGLPQAAEKAVLVPTAHDEPALEFGLYQDLFRLPRTLVFLSPEEKAMVNRKFRVANVRQEMAGYGIEIPEDTDGDCSGSFLYLGRIEAGKSCGELFSWALKAGIPLTAAGPASMKIPAGIDYRGIVTEQEKERLLRSAKAMIIPSRNESLSITALEAWAAGKPVIVSASSPVLSGQVERSGGGISYRNFEEFVSAAARADREMGKRGREFVRIHYSWDAVIKKWTGILENTAFGRTPFH